MPYRFKILWLHPKGDERVTLCDGSEVERVQQYVAAIGGRILSEEYVDGKEKHSGPIARRKG